MSYGNCEVYGKAKIGLNFFDFLKKITTEKKGWIETYKKVDLSQDSNEEEM